MGAVGLGSEGGVVLHCEGAMVLVSADADERHDAGIDGTAEGKLNFGCFASEPASYLSDLTAFLLLSGWQRRLIAPVGAILATQATRPRAQELDPKWLRLKR